ncbi:hypothetical protein D3C75_683510 [compost metagenome]
MLDAAEQMEHALLHIDDLGPFGAERVQEFLQQPVSFLRLPAAQRLKQRPLQHEGILGIRCRLAFPGILIQIDNLVLPAELAIAGCLLGGFERQRNG